MNRAETEDSATAALKGGGSVSKGRPARVTSGYSGLAVVGDAALRDGSGVHKDWRGMWGRLESTSRSFLEGRQAQAQRQLDDNGILLAGHAEANEPHIWPLNPVPFQMSSASFVELERGVVQRAQLLECLTADLLTEQRAIREKVLPPALLFANPYLYRAYLNLPKPRGPYLDLYGVDLYRDSGGQWWAQDDRTQAPSGLGFTLESRLAISMTHTDWYEQMQVRRHAGFFRELKRTLAEHCRERTSNPHVVILSEGPHGHRGFEDAFLARYLGYTLATGDDLATRGGSTVLKTLGGIMPVDIVLRRINDELCDPVELEGRSRQGVAGLVESCRSGLVTVTNAIGSRLTESPGLTPFFQVLCRFYLDEDLVLPTIPTWWCGQKAELDHVVEHLGELDVLSAFDSSSAPVDTSVLNEGQLEDLRQQILDRPEAYVGRARAQRTTTPFWTGDRLEPWFWSMRGFACSAGGGFVAMPGGLVRVASDGRRLDSKSTAGQHTQDCWVVSDEPVEKISLIPDSDAPVTLRRSGVELPSRIADNLYWLGRSVVAAEEAARMLRAAIDAVMTDEDVPTAEQLMGLMGSEAPVGEDADQSEILGRLAAAVLDTPAPGNFRQRIRECVRLAQSVRDRISLDAWRVITRMERHVLRTAAVHALESHDGAINDLTALLNHVILELAAFSGLMSQSMTRTLGWVFLDMGSRVERALLTTRLLQGTLMSGRTSPLSLHVLLNICDSTMTYRTRYLANLKPVPVLDLLLTDEINPRSVAHQLIELNAHVGKLPHDPTPGILSSEQRLSLALVDAVRLADPYALMREDEGGGFPALSALLERVRQDLPAIEQVITARYLVHAEPPQQYAEVVMPMSEDEDRSGMQEHPEA